MALRVQCPNCSKEIKAPSKYRGKKIECPGCKEHLVIPGSAAEDLPSVASPSVTTVSPANPGAFPPFSFSFGSASSEKPDDGLNDAPPEPPKHSTEPPEVEPEMQAMAYGVSVGMESKSNNDPLSDAIWLIITFWIATLVIAVAIFILWLAFMVFIARL